MTTPSKRRIAILRTELLPISETFIRDQAQALSEWKPVLVGYRALAGGLETPAIPREIAPSNRIIRALQTLRSLPDPNLLATLRRASPSVLHIHFGTDAVDFWPSIKRVALPTLVTLHGYDINTHKEWWKSGQGGWHRRSYPERLLEMARAPKVRFIAVSDALRRRAISFGIPADKIETGYIGINTTQFRPTSSLASRNRRRIIFVGRMVEKKAPLLLLQAFKKIIARMPTAELVMIGEGPLLIESKRYAHENRLPVEFLGRKSSSEIIANLQGAAVLCLPSMRAANGDDEGFGMVLLEAQACGVPVVTSALGGATEGLVHGVTGLAFEQGDIGALEESLIRILQQDAEERAMMTNACRRFVAENFELASCTRELEKTYKAMLENGQGKCA